MLNVEYLTITKCLSPFLFAMFLNDIEDVFVQNGVDGIELHMF